MEVPYQKGCTFPSITNLPCGKLVSLTSSFKHVGPYIQEEHTLVKKVRVHVPYKNKVDICLVVHMTTSDMNLFLFWTSHHVKSIFVLSHKFHYTKIFKSIITTTVEPLENPILTIISTGCAYTTHSYGRKQGKSPWEDPNLTWLWDRGSNILSNTTPMWRHQKSMGYICDLRPQAKAITLQFPCLLGTNTD